ncbi:PREDICTED: espin-like [Amphimedon queenslandica]|uniref:Uncharacterized protein n=1 Tax=Amphimedon queenslandica TaxID=400682 RepID=A0AAN0JE87_AMPQE|nr:PREDICTED: espin-like [Amphimedon queenslandica]|eukprot:XP_019855299.1 PREDICTED: espin-like [Amphimedon queenslandica]
MAQNQKSESRSSLCCNAFSKRDHKEAVELLQLQDPSVLYQCERTLLYYSIRNGWFDVTVDLITNYQFNSQSANYCNYLYTAIKGNHIDIVKYLLKECQCDPMLMVTAGEYGGKIHVLHYVAGEGLLDVLKCMVMSINGHIMDKQYHNARGQTVLHYAVGHINVVNYLINECNCDIMAPDKMGNNTLHIAARNGLLNVLKYFAHMCNPLTTNKSGQNVLHCAIEHIDVVKYLVSECSINIMITDNFGRIPLHYAASLGIAEVVEYLLLTGKCNPLAKDKKGKTPLQLAKEKSKSEVIIAIFKKFGSIKISHPIDSYVNILLEVIEIKHNVFNTDVTPIELGML